MFCGTLHVRTGTYVVEVACISVSMRGARVNDNNQPTNYRVTIVIIITSPQAVHDLGHMQPRSYCTLLCEMCTFLDSVTICNLCYDPLCSNFVRMPYKYLNDEPAYLKRS